MRAWYFCLFMVVGAIAPTAAYAAGIVSNLPAASQPLGTLPDAVLLDQGTGCPTASAPCVTSQSPSLRVGQPVQGASSPASPFKFQLWWDTSATPYVLKIYDGAQWVVYSSLNATTHSAANNASMATDASNASPLATVQTNLGIGAAGTLGIGAGLGSSGGNLLIPPGAITSAMLAGSVAPSQISLPNYGAGCLLSNDGVSPNTVIDIAACYTADDTTFFVMPQAGAYTKTMGVWVVGTGTGCLDTGVVAGSTWYHLYEIQRADTSVVDFLCTVTFGAPTMPAGYGRKRFIGSFLTDPATHILPFTQIGNQFIWKAPVTDVAAAACTTAAASATLASVAASHKVEANTRVSVVKVADSPILLVSSLDENDNAPGTPAGNYTVIAYVLGNTAVSALRVMTNGLQQVRQRCSVAGASLTIVTAGWTDPAIAWSH